MDSVPENKPVLPAEPSRDDVVVINQTTFYYFIIGAVFFAAGFIVAWVTFSTTIGSTISSIKNDTSAAAREAILTAVPAISAANTGANSAPVAAVQPTNVPHQTIDIGDSPVVGPADAKVTVVEFSDFQCPYCGDFYSHTLQLVRKNYGDKIRIVYKQFPLTQIHPFAMQSALASECAREQGKFWEYHDILFQNQADLSHDALVTYAKTAGVADVAQFTQCFDSKKYQSRVDADLQAGAAYGVGGTPTFFINGNYLSGDYPYADSGTIKGFSTILNQALADAAAKS